MRGRGRTKRQEIESQRLLGHVGEASMAGNTASPPFAQVAIRKPAGRREELLTRTNTPREVARREPSKI